MKFFWYLIEDFFEQSIVMQGFLALGWLAILIMVLALWNGMTT